MKTSIQSVAGKRFFVVNTEIPVAAYREGITNLSVVTDEKEGSVFCMDIDLDAAVGAVSGFGIVANGKVDDNYAVLIPLTAEDEVEDIKKAYGAKLVAAKAGLEKLKEQMTKEAADVDAICEGIEEQDDAPAADAE